MTGVWGIVVHTTGIGIVLCLKSRSTRMVTFCNSVNKFLSTRWSVAHRGTISVVYW